MKTLLVKIRSLFAEKYQPLVIVEICRNNIMHNLKYYQKMASNMSIAPVLKSNAYGHGLVLLAKILNQEQAPFLIIDSYYEAVILRKNKITKPLLIIGYTKDENIYNNKLKNITYTITSFQQLANLSHNLKKSTNFHLKFDTGMFRQGLLVADFLENVPRGTFSMAEVFTLLKNNSNLKITGIFSHFSDADNKDQFYTNNQVQTWNSLVEACSDRLLFCKYFHIAASAGLENVPRGTFSKHTNMVRLGLGLYGYSLNQDISKELKPALSMHTIITSTKKVPKGSAIGYSKSFISSKEMIIATIPVGYYEGVDKRISNKGCVKVFTKNVPRGTFCPIVGRVSMNITTIDVSALLDCQIGDKVEVISQTPSDTNSINNLSKISNTIPYEPLVKIPEKLHRKCV